MFASGASSCFVKAFVDNDNLDTRKIREWKYKMSEWSNNHDELPTSVNGRMNGRKVSVCDKLCRFRRECQGPLKQYQWFKKSEAFEKERDNF